jgi:nitrite reductase (cytochrome c-552)
MSRRVLDLRNTAMDALIDLIHDLEKLRKAGSSAVSLQKALNYQRKAASETDR